MTSRDHFSKTVTMILIILGVLLIILLMFLTRTYFALRRMDLLSRPVPFLSASVAPRIPLSVTQAGIIRPWMTFGYLNILFGLPKDYLKNQLHISDPRYPNLTLGGYAAERRMTSAEALREIKRDIIAYSQPLSV